MRYEFHPEAEREFYEAALRYEQQVPGLAARFGNEIERVIELLMDHPESGVRVDDHLRHFVLRKFPFSIVYTADADVLRIVAIAHGSREPEYWQFRVHDRPR